MSHEATLRFSYDSPTIAETVERSLRPEVGAIRGDRSVTTVDREAGTLFVTITATDPRALRAAKATWFSLVLAAEGAVEAVGSAAADAGRDTTG